ncbi:MAG: hypothetical protein JWP79_475 [Polaromonas sp.]|nr:hypothetical protein [Polaromonas sp.]
MPLPSSKPATGPSAWSLLSRRLGAVVLAVGVLPVMAQTAAKSPAAAAATAARPAVQVVLTQAKVVRGADGKEQLLDAASVKPGDILEYRATYKNTSDKAVQGVVATLPIPEGLEYLPASAKPGAKLVQAAAKDAVYAAEPLSRVVAGKSVPVPYADYRSLRWSLGQLPAGGEAAVSARAKVQVYVPPAAIAASSSAAAPQAPPSAAKP